MKLHTLTDIGVKRSENQDNYWSAILDVNGNEMGVICLCDGMGGLNNGGKASRMVVKTIRDYILSDFIFDGLETVIQKANGEIHRLPNNDKDNRLVVQAIQDYILSNFIFEGLENVIQKVNKEIFRLSYGDSSKIMGTTCTTLICYEGTYAICHVGDSRAYVFKNGIPNLLTSDHSAVNLYNISRKENPKMWYKYKNKLTRCIGVKNDVKLDHYRGYYEKNDVFFLCSDGCWHYFDDISMSLEKVTDLNTLFKKCILNGETDNLTAGILVCD